MSHPPRVPDEILPPALPPPKPSVWQTRARFVAFAVPVAALALAVFEVAVDRVVPNTWFAGAVLLWVLLAALAIVYAPTLRETVIQFNAAHVVAFLLAGVGGIGGAYALGGWVPAPALISTNRHLSRAESAALTDTLRELRDVKVVRIFHVRSPEAMQYAKEIRDAVEAAGLPVRRGVAEHGSDYLRDWWTPVGLTIFAETEGQQAALRASCDAVDLDADVDTMFSGRGYEVAFWVGWNTYTYTPQPDRTPESEMRRQHG